MGCGASKRSVHALVSTLTEVVPEGAPRMPQQLPPGSAARKAEAGHGVGEVLAIVYFVDLPAAVWEMHSRTGTHRVQFRTAERISDRVSTAVV